jgi:hypothetical protein
MVMELYAFVELYVGCGLKRDNQTERERERV